MIINHKHKIIFIKTKKTAGTSFEIALSKFCDEGDVITPITPADELLRQKLGFKGAQNYKNADKNNNGLWLSGNYYNHIPSKIIKSTIPKRMWDGYKKITIYRNPFDSAISRYYWEGGEKTGLNYLQYLQKFTSHLLENKKIAPLSGDGLCDVYLRYENMKLDLERQELDMIWEVFCLIRAKSNRRPRVGSSIFEIYNKFPKAIEIINKLCNEEIKFFKYPQPTDMQKD
jgi:hypothetical protein